MVPLYAHIITGYYFIFPKAVVFCARFFFYKRQTWYTTRNCCHHGAPILFFFSWSTAIILYVIPVLLAYMYSYYLHHGSVHKQYLCCIYVFTQYRALLYHGVRLWLVYRKYMVVQYLLHYNVPGTLYMIYCYIIIVCVLRCVIILYSSIYGITY